jgi:hypothetical protein
MHYNLKRLVCCFPKEFEKVFIFNGAVTKEDVVKIIIPHVKLSKVEEDLLHVLYQYIDQCNEQGGLCINLTLNFFTFNRTAEFFEFHYRRKRYAYSSQIFVKFSNNLMSSVKADTCANTLYISTLIQDSNKLIFELKIITSHDTTYTTL